MHIFQPAKNFLRLPTDKSINPEVQIHFKRNFIVNVVDAILWMLGESFVSVYTILPVFSQHLDGFSHRDWFGASLIERRLVYSTDFDGRVCETASPEDALC